MSRSFSRRQFLQGAAVTGAALVLAPRGTRGAPGEPAKPSLVKVSGPGVPADLSLAVRKALEPLGGMGAFVKRGQVVMLKPNMGFPTPPAQRANTSPALVAAVTALVLEAGAKKVLVVDNPLRRPEACMKVGGHKEAVEKLGAHLIMPTAERLFVEKEIPGGRVLKRTDVFRDALEVDVHIALPIAKSHMATGYSGGLKGMMGLVLDRESFHSRFDLNQAVADLNTLLKAQLIILDGLQVMATDGPSGPGELITCNTVIAGTDIVAVDAAGVTLAPLYGRKIKPKQVKHLLCSEKSGVGTLSPPESQIVTVGM